MKISIFAKTFALLFFIFTCLFVGSNVYLYTQFAGRYIDENINAVKLAILNNATTLENDTLLTSTILTDASSETQYIRFQNNAVIASVGPEILPNDDLLDFVIALYDSPELISEGALSYTVRPEYDVYHISYIYRFGSSDYLLVLTKIQSLRNVDRILLEMTWTQGMILIVAIFVISFFLSRHLASPIRKINQYAKAIARLDFGTDLQLNRRDEFKELVTSLNEMVFNLKKTYQAIDAANAQLANDIAFEQTQEKKKKQLIMTINHELKTPIAVVKGMVEGMLDNVGRYQDKDRYLREVLEELEKVDKMTKDLTYSLKLEDLAKPDDHCTVDSLKETLHPLVELAHQRDLQLKVAISSAEVKMNAELLGMIATNLTKNALHYTSGSPVTVTTYSEATDVILEIRNPGHIEDAHLTELFKPYVRFQIDTEGQGLGLYIVKQICELTGADIKLFNDNGEVVAKCRIPRWTSVTPLP